MLGHLKKGFYLFLYVAGAILAPCSQLTADTPEVTYLSDYQSPAFQVTDVFLDVDIQAEETLVISKLRVRRDNKNEPLILNGSSHQELVGVQINGKDLAEDAYTMVNHNLIIDALPSERYFVVQIMTRIFPEKNSDLSGLYSSRGIYCTQCESEGFRRITFFPDRPDVMARYTTTITGDKALFPLMISNGNLTEFRDNGDGTHTVTWVDPFPKPSYLFAMVAGDLVRISDQFTTMNGREVSLEIYVERGNEGYTQHAMKSLKKAMLWDEEVYGREYDLGSLKMVAIDDFNAGAMENKGLLIFNSNCLLADHQTSTDSEFEFIEEVVGHEYFHNWSGNRVTLANWFNLALKEGFTEFRNQEFSADMNSVSVRRIDDVALLRQKQFPEDAGPNAHAVQPASYIDISNFYTMTVYHKGAELYRMLRTLLGTELFRQGTDLYFERHDGEAVQLEQFFAAMEDASGWDLTQFRHWTTQAGTPEVKVEMEYDELAQEVHLKVSQWCRPTPETGVKQPYLFPLTIGLLDKNGRDMLLEYNGEMTYSPVLVIKESEQTFTFKNIPHRPIPSLLRHFSAPVKLDYSYSSDELGFLLEYDSDLFNRYEAGQRLSLRIINGLIARIQRGRAPLVNPGLLRPFRRLIENKNVDPALRARVLSLPSLGTILDQMPVVDLDAANQASRVLKKALSHSLQEIWQDIIFRFSNLPIKMDEGELRGHRALRNVALNYLAATGSEAAMGMAYRQYTYAHNMTDRLAALRVLTQTHSSAREVALKDFHDRFMHDPRVMNKWFAVQGSAGRPGLIEGLRELEEDPAYDQKNPNKLRSLIGAFIQNLPAFHAADGSGYAYVAEKIIEIDRYNKEVAAKFAKAFDLYPRLDENRRALMREHLKCILSVKGISDGVYEMIAKTLNTDAPLMMAE